MIDMDVNRGESRPPVGNQGAGEKVVYHLINVRNLLRPPVTNYTKRKKLTVKLGGLWGVKVHRST